jgi:hypothetical protein
LNEDWHNKWIEVDEAIEEPQPQRSKLWRVVYTLVLIFIILLLILTQTGLAQLLVLGRVNAQSIIGRTEAEVINRLGEPDFRSVIQTFMPGEGFGPLPQNLEAGDQYYFLNYTIGPRVYIFHLVSPETYAARTGRLVVGEQWVVMDVASHSRFVVF